MLGRGGSVLLIAGGVGALVVAGLMPCPMATVLRVPCPGCGLTRATMCLLHGDLSGMLRFHPLTPLILLFLAGYFGLNAAGYVARGRWGWVDERMGRATNGVVWLFVALTLGVWLARFAGCFGGPVPV